MRITEKDLEAVARRLNIITGSPEHVYTKHSDGKYRANVGNYHISYEYGGYRLDRIDNESGGVSCPIIRGHVSKRELYGLMQAYINGILEMQNREEK